MIVSIVLSLWLTSMVGMHSGDYLEWCEPAAATIHFPAGVVMATAASNRSPLSADPSSAKAGRAPSPDNASSPADQRTPLTGAREVVAGNRRIVALDIGHTVGHPGAISATGATEFSFNRRIVQLLAARLKRSAHIEPYVINPSGGAVTLLERTRLAKARGAALFLSVHHDSVQPKYLVPWTVGGKRLVYADDFHGYGVFVSQKNPRAPQSFAFAQLLGGEMARQGFEFSPHHSEPVPGENRQILDKYNGVYRYDDLIVLKTAAMPAVLLECGVIINRAEEKLLNEPATRDKIVAAITAALERYFEAATTP